jgi:outer membrane receptor protein involved in Fe transport
MEARVESEAQFVPSWRITRVRPSNRLYRCVLIASACVSSLAFAQGTAVVTGIVTDAATSKPVPDVVITATSSALQGEEVVVTDSSGTYRLAQLPAGVYTLKLEKESFKPYSRTDINVRTDRTVRVNIQLQPEAVQGDTVVVVGKPPTVDIGSTTTGINVGKDFINNIAFIQPNGSGVRSFESLASVAPQVIADEYGFGFSGAQSPENLYLVDGVSTGDPAFGTSGAQFPVEFVEEANVITGGYQAEFGRSTGGVLNVVTKSGSNEFHGMVWGNWTPGALQGTPKTIDSAASAVQLQPKLLNTLDFGAQVGGPIIKDRLWFFVGFAPSFNWDRTTRSLRAFVTDPVTGEETNPVVPGTTREREESQRAFSYIAKLTFLINADNNISLSVVGSPSSDTTPFSFNERRATKNGWNGGVNATNDSNTLSARYQGSFLEKHVLLDASVGWFRLRNSTLPTDGSGFSNVPGDGTAAGTPAVIYRRTNPRPITQFETLTAEGLAVCVDAATCPATGGGATYTIGGFGFMEDATVDRVQGRASATFLFQGLGHHIVKAGLDVEHLRYDVKTAYSGGNLLRENPASTRFDDFRQYGYYVSPDEAIRQPGITSTPTSNNIGAYLQDSWSVMDLVTLNLGLRYDNQQLFAADGTLGMTLNNMISPRVGVIYDFTQQGRSKLFANYSRFYEAMPLDIANRALTGENQYQFQHTRAANAPGYGNNPGCDPLADIDQALNECLDPRNNRRVNRINGGDYDPSASGLQTGAGKTPVDANLKPQSSDEIVVGGEYEIISDGRVGVTYTRRYMNSVIEDMSTDEASTYFIGNPGEGIASQFPKAVRDYDAVTGYFNKAFSDGWMGQVSYTYSSLRGNYNGLFRPETGQLNPNINADFDLISLLPNRTGPLDADRNHFIKAYASKEFQITSSFSLVAGLTYEGRSGAPINYLGGHPIYGADEAFVLPRGAGGRLPWRHAINAKGGVRYRISKDNVVEFTADVFNMFNFQAVTAVDNTITSSDVLPFQTNSKDPQAAACLAGNSQPQCTDGNTAIDTSVTNPDGSFVKLTRDELNSNFKRPTAYQAPISVRFGIRFSF